ncbi:MAG: hypothetical protein JOZ55_12210, partial [Alphaproteobacteria bacterium]|nr:hypothetical protein [Alphaproteobacteria bacterium]
LQYFHSDLHLILDQNVGLFVSLNSAGKNETPFQGTRTLLFDGFMDRYFPGPALAPARPLASAAADAKKVAGFYKSSRRSETNFLRTALLVQPFRIVANADGSLSMPLFDGSGPQIKWIETAPFLWREAHGRHRLAAVLDRGRVKWLSTDYIPAVMVLQPLPLFLAPAVQVPMLVAALGMLALTVLFWPVKAVLRWRYDQPFALRGRAAALYRLTRIVALIDILLFAGWTAFLLAGQANLDVFSPKNDTLIRGLQVLAVLAIAGAVIPVLEFVAALRDPNRPWWTKASDGLVMLAALWVVWFVFAYRLVTASLNY